MTNSGSTGRTKDFDTSNIYQVFISRRDQWTIKVKSGRLPVVEQYNGPQKYISVILSRNELNTIKKI